MITGDTRARLIQSFRPEKEVDEPQFFAGRKKLISDLLDALRADSSLIVIHGERGLGKTSLAAQLRLIALGDAELLDYLKMESDTLNEEDRFNVIWLSCTDEISNTHKLYRRLASEAEIFEGLESIKPSEKTVTESLNLKVYKIQVENSYKSSGRLSEYRHMSAEEHLISILRYIVQVNNKKVLIILDEVDRIKHLSGLGSFLKSFCNDDIRFCLVGIADTVSDLIDNHASIERKICPIKVPKMRPAEVAEIIAKAMDSLEDLPQKPTFTSDAIENLTTAAAGFPWFAHVLGREALLNAAGELNGKNKNDRIVVRSDNISKSISTLSETRYSEYFEHTYTKCVRESEHREIVLRLFAKYSDNKIPTSQMYPKAKALGVGNPSKCVRELCKESNGAILKKSSSRNGLYAFANAMFCRYVNLRPSYFPDVKSNVDSIWKSSLP